MMLGLTHVGATSANISRAYHTGAQLNSGSIVSLDPQRSDYVQPASTDNGARLLGVAVAANDSLLAVNDSAGLAQIATSGNARVLVSTVNGDVAVGDQIGVSPFLGIGMKAMAGSRVIGLSESVFSAQSSSAKRQTITDRTGKRYDISVGYTSVSIAVGTYKPVSGGPQLNALQKLGKSLTGHTVSTLRVVLSMIITLMATLSLITLVYASVYGGIISVGRNPLAKYAVFKSVGMAMIMASLTALLAGLTIFLLLR